MKLVAALLEDHVPLAGPWHIAQCCRKDQMGVREIDDHTNTLLMIPVLRLSLESSVLLRKHGEHVPSAAVGFTWSCDICPDVVAIVFARLKQGFSSDHAHMNAL